MGILKLALRIKLCFKFVFIYEIVYICSGQFLIPDYL